MQRLITNEFIMYKAGFIHGKEVILNIIDEPLEDKLIRELIKLKDIDQLIKNENSVFYCEPFEENSWYSYGYDDAYRYYLSEYVEHGYILKDELLRKGSELVMQRLFMKRVSKYNEENDDKIVGAKFKM